MDRFHCSALWAIFCTLITLVACHHSGAGTGELSNQQRQHQSANSLIVRVGHKLQPHNRGDSTTSDSFVTNCPQRGISQPPILFVLHKCSWVCLCIVLIGGTALRSPSLRNYIQRIHFKLSPVRSDIVLRFTQHQYDICRQNLNIIRFRNARTDPTHNQ